MRKTRGGIRGVCSRIDCDVEAGEAGATARIHCGEVEEKGEVPVACLHGVACVEIVVMRFVVLARKVPHRLQRLEVLLGVPCARESKCPPSAAAHVRRSTGGAMVICPLLH